MKPLTLQSTIHFSHTYVPNYFLDIYMPKASGEFVKIYLYILRCLLGDAAIDNCSSYKSGCPSYTNTPDCFCVSFIADRLNLTENDVLRALKYWEKEGLLKLSYSTDDSGSQELSGITVITPSNELIADADNVRTQGSARKTEPQNTSAVPSVSYKKPSYTAAQLKQFADNEELEQLLYITQKYIGKPLSASETNSIIFLYDTVRMTPDMIEYLLEYCISTGHKSMRYIEKVAVSWAESGIRTVEEAKQHSFEHSEQIFSVLKAFGISGRTAAKVEQDYIHKWNDSYCFSSEIIIEACNRTIQAIHRPSFEYADTILSKWKEHGIKNLEDIRALDEEFEKTRKTAAKSSVRLNISDRDNKTINISGSNRFNNFSQRDYDYEEFEKTFVNKGLV